MLGDGRLARVWRDLPGMKPHPRTITLPIDTWTTVPHPGPRILRVVFDRAAAYRTWPAFAGIAEEASAL